MNTWEQKLKTAKRYLIELWLIAAGRSPNIERKRNKITLEVLAEAQAKGLDITNNEVKQVILETVELRMHGLKWWMW